MSLEPCVRDFKGFPYGVQPRLVYKQPCHSSTSTFWIQCHCSALDLQAGSVLIYVSQVDFIITFQCLVIVHFILAEQIKYGGGVKAFFFHLSLSLVEYRVVSDLRKMNYMYESIPHHLASLSRIQLGSEMRIIICQNTSGVGLLRTRKGGHFLYPFSHNMGIVLKVT